MRTFILALTFAAALVSTACGTKELDANAAPKTETVKAVDPKVAAHETAVKEASGQFAAIMNPPTAAPKWEDGFNGETGSRAVCDLQSSYNQLAMFIGRHGENADVPMKDIDTDSTAEPERHKRGVAYFATLFTFIKTNPVPSCLKSNTESDDVFIEGIPRDLESLGVKSEEVNVTPVEIRALYLVAVKKSTPALLVKYRKTPSGDTEKFERSTAIQRFCALAQEKHLTAQEIGVSASDYAKFSSAEMHGEGGYCLAGECESDKQK